MRRLHRGGLVLGAIILALVLVAVPAGRNRFKRSPELANRERLGTLLTACRLFAVDHSGRYPTHLDALAPDFLTADVLEASRYEVIDQNKSAGVQLDWLYFGNGFDDTHPPRVLIASPQVVTDAAGQQSRLYLAGDGLSHTATEEAYQKDLAETVRQIQEMLKRGRVAPVAPVPAAIPTSTDSPK